MVHRCKEAAFLVEIPRHDFLYQLVGIKALLSGRLGEFRFEFGAFSCLQTMRQAAFGQVASTRRGR
jgi:hypothetical protein